MCGTVAWLQGNTCGDDEQFNLAAWFPSLLQSWLQAVSFSYFVILGQCKLHGVFNFCSGDEVHLLHNLAANLHLVVRMDDKLRLAIGVDEALAIIVKFHVETVLGEVHQVGIVNDQSFYAFDRLMKRVMPHRVNAAYSRASVKNISQTLFNKPFIKWHYDPGLMKRREPYDRMVAIVERLIILLTTPEKH